MAQPLRPTIVSRHSMSPWRALLIMLGLALYLCAQQTVSENQVKAAFLLNFTKFIEWPPGPAGADAPMTICVLGEDPFGPLLTQMGEGETVNGRPIAIQRSRRDIPKNCQILYVGKGEKAIPEILSGTGREVLTVGDGEGFLREGGIIAFVLENHHVRFMINLAAARNSALKFSSKLLNVAKTVEK